MIAVRFTLIQIAFIASMQSWASVGPPLERKSSPDANRAKHKIKNPIRENYCSAYRSDITCGKNEIKTIDPALLWETGVR